MRDLSQSCIFDDSSENLNTTMNITLEGEKYKVAVCDACEDQAAPSAIKKIIPDRLSKLDEKNEQLEALKKAAADLGFDLVKTGTSKLMIPTVAAVSPDFNDLAPVNDSGLKIQKNTRAKPKQQQQQQQSQQQQMTPEEADAAIEAAKRGAARTKHLESATAGEAASYSSHDTSETVQVQTRSGNKTYSKPETFSKEVQTIRGRAGVPTTIPKSMHSSDGKTTIKIVNTGGDRALQDRARQLGALREHGDGSFYSSGCRPCGGKGFHGLQNKPCRTCNGTGIII